MAFMNESNELVWKRSTNCSEPEDDVWDDRALISAYDRAVRKVNQRIAEHSIDNNLRINNNNNAKQWKANNASKNVSNDSINSQMSSNSSTQNSINGTNGHNWTKGQYCRTVYNEDGVEYEAQIVSINPHLETCFVKYIGYDNEEEKAFKDLKPSLGKKSRKLQTQMIEKQNLYNSNSDTDNDINNFSNKMTNHFNARIEPSNDSWCMPSNSSTDAKSSQPIVPPPLPFSHSSRIPEDDESLASMLMSWYMSGYHTGYYMGLKQIKQNCKCNK